MDEDWQSQSFRQNIITKINDIMRSSGQDSAKNASVMENHIFKKSQTREDYLGLVAKLFIHYKDVAQRRPQQPPPSNAEMGQQGMMQDPLNALQNLATQGNRNPQMMPIGGASTSQVNVPSGSVAASNLLQTLNQQRPGQQQMQQQIRGQMPMGAGGGQQIVSVPVQQMNPNMGGGGQQQSQLVGSAQQVGGMAGQMSNAGPGPSPNPMQGGPMNVNAMNVQMQHMPQMSQMNPNQINMGMNHPQLNQMMAARMSQGGQQSMPGIPPNMQQNQAAGHMHPSNMPTVQGQVSGGAGNVQQMLNMPPNIQQKANMSMAQSGQMYPVNRGVGGQQQFLRQSPSPSTVPSPAGMNISQQQQLQQQQQAGLNQQQQQQQGGPTQHQQSQAPQLPNPQMIPSPAMVPTSSPQMTNLMQSNQRNLRQSPSSSLNTPGQVSSNSPFNPQEEQLYREKYKQLTKYIEPLKRMVAKMTNEGQNTEKMTKMNKLLEILANPTQRVPLETLLKCEKALERMDIVSMTGQQFGKSSNPLLEVINTTLQSPIANHTLRRTFWPVLEILFNSDICGIKASKRRHDEDKKSSHEFDITHVMQREFASLDPKFKISIDDNAQDNSKVLTLICCLDDMRLPSVPPLTANLTDEYPFKSPLCHLAKVEHRESPFLSAVYDAFQNRYANLPNLFSLSHVLHTWEMAVRYACSVDTK